ncbi:Peroxisomal membrane protein PMP27, partial [Mortierella sp. AD032]
MRIGKPVEHLEAAAIATGVKDEFLRFCAVGKQLAYAGYLSYDALIFLDGAGAYKFTNIKRYTELANKFWLAGIVFSFVSSLYKTRQIQIRRHSALRGLKHRGESEKSYSRTELSLLDREQHALNKALLLDGLDLLIPSSGLGYVDLDDGVVGLIGTATSLMGAESHWAKVNAKA